MRIVGGEFRGRSLAAPKSRTIRPTTDRSRESLFNILSHAWPDALDDTRMLDLFAGTGAVGLEGLSRGVGSVLFVETSAEGRALIRTNIEALDVTHRAKIFRRDATSIGQVGTIRPFDLVFADPPYRQGAGDRALRAAAAGGWLNDGALVILEEAGGVEPDCGAAFCPLERRNFGDTAMHFYKYTRSAAD